jgi:hypothetical protein
MKSIKALVIIALVFATNIITAQSVAAKWPAMQTYETVITRINNGVEQNNESVIKSFTGTLFHFSQELTTSTVPTEFKTAKITEAVVKLQNQTKKLNDMVAGGSTDASMRPVFKETYSLFQDVLKMMTNVK